MRRTVQTNHDARMRQNGRQIDRPVGDVLTTTARSYLVMVKYQKILSCDPDLWLMILKFNRVLVVVENSVKLSAAVYELPW